MHARLYYSEAFELLMFKWSKNILSLTNKKNFFFKKQRKKNLNLKQLIAKNKSFKKSVQLIKSQTNILSLLFFFVCIVVFSYKFLTEKKKFIICVSKMIKWEKSAGFGVWEKGYLAELLGLRALVKSRIVPYLRDSSLISPFGCFHLYLNSLTPY